MTFLPVLLWSDLLIWLLVLAAIALGVASSRNPPLRTAWRRVGQSRRGMAAATVLVAFTFGPWKPFEKEIVLPPTAIPGVYRVRDVVTRTQQDGTREPIALAAQFEVR